MKLVIVVLVSLLIFTPVLAETAEVQPVHNFMQEFDLTFWQTLPWAALWSHFAERQIKAQTNPGSSADWQVIFSVATVTSAANAFFHARHVMENERTGRSN
ncbi:hypothetical protein ACFL5U_00715 [Candidatus Margulisiibacteriota bacterium]